MTENTAAAADRQSEIAALLVGAVDLHCHSGPAVFPRLLDHAEAMHEASAAGFSALVYKDHFYPGMAHARLLETLYPDIGVRLYSGVALNNASGGINPYAVDHAVKLGGKIVWMPTFAAANHIDKSANETKNYPKSASPMLAPIPLSVLDENGRLNQQTQDVLDVIAAGDIILAGGHLSVGELKVLFPEAKRRGVRKMLVNHPTYVIGCSDDDIRELAALGVYMEHSICMFIPNQRGPAKWDVRDLCRLVEVAGTDRTILGSDLGLVNMPRPVEGYRAIVNDLIEAGMPRADIEKIVSTNAASLL